MSNRNDVLFDAFSSKDALAAGGKKHVGAHVFTAILFALFVITLLLAIMAGTNVYGSVTHLQQAAAGTRLSLGLITNTVRANDTVDAIAVGEGPEGRSLVMVETLDSGSYETRIYLYKGHIVQEYSLAGAAYTPDRANEITESSVFEFSYSNGLLTITTDDGSTNIALRSAEGGA